MGRRREIGTLNNLLIKAKTGKGAALGIFGEAGVGKSRLLYEFRQVLGNEILYLEGRCLPYGGISADRPVATILRNLCGLGDHSAASFGENLSWKFEGLKKYLPSFEDLLGFPVSDADYSQLAPQVKRDRLIEGLVQIVLSRSAVVTVVIAIEDLHWIDQTTEEFIEDLIGRIGEHRVLLVFLARPEYDPAWRQLPTYHQERLSLLSDNDTHQLVKSLFDAPVDGALERYVITHTEGNPFFAEELTRELSQSGALSLNGSYRLASPPEELQMPETVQGVLAARMDKLDLPTRSSLQMASVIGHEFSPALLENVQGTNGDLAAQLETLTELEFILPHPESGYAFKHALTRDVAYSGLLKRNRKRLHRQVCESIKELSPEIEANHPEVLAHHYTESGMAAEAISYWQAAGQKAIQRSSNKEAIDYLTKAIDLLAALPETAARKQQELSLLVALGVPLISTKGYASPDAESAYARAQELCQQLGQSRKLSMVLRGLWSFHNMRGDTRKARMLAEQSVELAQNEEDEALLMEAHRALAVTLFGLGELTSAHAHLKRATANYDSQQHGSHAFAYGQDPGVGGLSQTACVMWYLGYPDQALQKMQEALDLAKKVEHPFSLAGAYVYAAIIHQLRREPAATRVQAEAAISISAEQGFALFSSMSKILRGWALVGEGQTEVGIEQMREGIGAHRSTGTVWMLPDFLVLLAEACSIGRMPEEGLVALSDALAIVKRTGERRCEAELWRLRGDLLFICKECDTDIEACYRRALDVARNQGARSPELRAVMSLSRFFQRQGNSSRARLDLSACYDQFAEGVDAPDLKEARTLLADLGA